MNKQTLFIFSLLFACSTTLCTGPHEKESAYQKNKRRRNENKRLDDSLKEEEKAQRKKKEEKAQQKALEEAKINSLERERTGYHSLERESIQRADTILLKQMRNHVLEDHKEYRRISERIKHEKRFRYPRNFFGGFTLLCGSLGLAWKVKKALYPQRSTHGYVSEEDRLEDNFLKPATSLLAITVAFQALVSLRNGSANISASLSKRYGNQYSFIEKEIKKREQKGSA